jgi:hypothetical protein
VPRATLDDAPPNALSVTANTFGFMEAILVNGSTHEARPESRHRNAPYSVTCAVILHAVILLAFHLPTFSLIAAFSGMISFALHCYLLRKKVHTLLQSTIGVFQFAAS